MPKQREKMTEVHSCGSPPSCVLEKQIVNTDGIKELLPELKRIGNNLNQIAKRCNEGGMLPSEAEVRKHGEEETLSNQNHCR